MALSTSTDSLAVGASRTFNLSPGSALTLVAPPNVRATITETPNTVSASGVGGNSSRTHNLQLGQTVTYGPYPMGGTVVVANASNSGGAVTWVRSDALVAESASGVVSLVSGDGTTYGPISEIANIAAIRGSDGYHYAGWARDQIATTTKLFDQSGNGNDAALQAGVSAATAWATAGLFTMPNPTGTTDLAEIPTLDFDYAGGETLLLFWRGFATPEGSDMPLLGDTGDGSATTRQGLNLICTSAGKMKFWLRDSAGALSASGTSTATCFEAAVEHTLAVCLDGLTRKYAFYVDGVRESAFVPNFLTFASGARPDTISGRTLKLGGSGRVSGGVQDGIASQTRALHVLRRAIGLGAPTGIDDIVANLHRDPTRLVSAEAW